MFEIYSLSLLIIEPVAQVFRVRAENLRTVALRLCAKGRSFAENDEAFAWCTQDFSAPEFS
jgi:hypothetical protein